ncbi:MAG: hypothetical protein ABW022_11175 [Actinoplanes sp.]
MNTREAIVINTLNGGLPFLDMDPVQLETDVDRELANAFSDDVMSLWEAVVEVELETDPTKITLSVVWSDTGARVQFLCPVCDDQCDLDDGATEDLPDNTCAMVCSSCLDD